MSITLAKTTSSTSAGTPSVTVKKGATDKAPLLVEFSVDTSSCTFDNTEDYDASFDEDFSGKTHDPSKHRLLYLWDLDDDESQWTAPENIPVEYLNRSKALGKKIQHVYTTTQSVNWKLEIWEPSSGKKAYASGSFTVDDPLETAEHIVLVNPNGDTDFTEITRDNYPGAAFYQEELLTGNVFGSGSEFSTYEGFDNVCWLLKTGGTYVVTVDHNGSGNYPYLGQYGTSSSIKPIASTVGGIVINNTQQGVGTPVAEMRIQNIVFQGDWSTYDSVAAPSTSSVVGVRPKGGWRTIVADCEFNDIAGQSIRMDAVDIAVEVYIGVANTVFHNIMGAEYPIIIGNGSACPVNDFCFIGIRYTDETTLLSGPSQSSTNGNHRAFIRHNSPTHIHVRGCDFFRLAGGHGQPVMKLNKASRHGPYLGVQFCAAECSENFVNFVEDKTGQPVSVSDAGILECCVIMHLPEGQRIAGATSTSNTVRSCLVIAGTWSDIDLSQGDATYRSRGLFLPGGDGVYQTGDEAPNEVYNCHAINLRTQAQNAGRLWGSDVNDSDTTNSIGGEEQVLRDRSNFVHAPKQTGGEAVITYAPIKDNEKSAGDAISKSDGSEMRFRFLGWNPAGTPDTTYSYNNDYVPSGLFEAGSSAFGGAASDIYWPLDYLGRLCGPNRAFGASDRPDYTFDIQIKTE